MPKPRQPKARKILSSKTTVLGLLMILILIVWAIVHNLENQQVVDEQTLKLEQEIQDLEQQNTELAGLIDYFASNEFVEKEAREKLNLGKPGEKVVIIPKDNPLAPETQTKPQAVKSSFSRWWLYFFGSHD